MTKEELFIWNWQIIHFWEWVPEITITIFSDQHIRITRASDGAKMDFWPSTGRGLWISGYFHKAFKIPCLDKYLNDKFFKGKYN